VRTLWARLQTPVAAFVGALTGVGALLLVQSLGHPAARPPTKAASEDDRRAAADGYAQRLAARIARHDRERRDEGWATPKERVLGEQLKQIAADAHLDFTLVGVDCRVTTCVARLHWPSRDAARAELHGLLSATAPIICARDIAFPPSPQYDGPYEAPLLIDCTDSM
jgi:hypothetical protein